MADINEDSETPKKAAKVESEQKAVKKELDKIEISLIKEGNDADDENHHHALFSIDFNLEINNRKKLKRRLYKCDLCTYSNIIDLNSNDDKSIKYHIFNEHLCLNDEEEQPKSCSDGSDEEIVKQALDRILDQIESSSVVVYDDPTPNRQPLPQTTTLSRYTFKCNQCKESDEAKFVKSSTKAQLTRHILTHHSDSINKLKCFYCSKLFDVKSISDYLSHLKMNHKQFIINDLLINKKSFNEAKFDQRIDWLEYFEESPNDEVIRYKKFKFIK